MRGHKYPTIQKCEALLYCNSQVRNKIQMKYNHDFKNVKYSDC